MIPISGYDTDFWLCHRFLVNMYIHQLYGTDVYKMKYLFYIVSNV